LTTATVNRKGASIAYDVLGDGPPVVFAHCSSASRREWGFAARELAATRRCYMPDLMGYGESSSQFDADGAPIECRDPDIVEAMVDLAGEPVDIVAHSFGAATALEFAKSRPAAVRSLFMIEPVAFQLLDRPGFEQDWRRITKLADNIIQAERRGQYKRAATHYMGFWIGRLKWAFAPRKFRENVIRTVSKVAFEFSLIHELSPSADLLGVIDAPTTLVCGSRSPRPARSVAAIVADALPSCRRETLRGAGHMSPFTHRQRVFELVAEHFGRG